MGDNKVPQSEKKPQYQPGEGIRSMQSTTLFRAFNFELYAKPVRLSESTTIIFDLKDTFCASSFQNMVIMVIGGVCFASALGYVAYMRSKYESQGYYPAVQPDGSEVYTKRRSKWE